MTLGQKIKSIREMLGLTQYELADKAGLTPAAVSQYENDKRVPELTAFIKICKALGVKIEKFLEDVEL